MGRKWCFYLLTVLVGSRGLWALNTHDLTGLHSDVWTLTFDLLYERIQSSGHKTWMLKLSTPKEFPFEVKWSDEKICFQNADPTDPFTQNVYYPSFNYLAVASKTATCCFETDYRSLMDSGVEKNLVREIHLELAGIKKVDEYQIATFKVKYPQKILSEFYCSSIVDEADGERIKRSHVPSLAEIDSVLGKSFKLMPDSI